jgi:hypothetical protein
MRQRVPRNALLPHLSIEPSKPALLLRPRPFWQVDRRPRAEKLDGLRVRFRDHT